MVADRPSSHARSLLAISVVDLDEIVSAGDEGLRPNRPPIPSPSEHAVIRRQLACEALALQAPSDDFIWLRRGCYCPELPMIFRLNPSSAGIPWLRALDRRLSERRAGEVNQAGSPPLPVPAPASPVPAAISTLPPDRSRRTRALPRAATPPQRGTLACAPRHPRPFAWPITARAII